MKLQVVNHRFENCKDDDVSLGVGDDKDSTKL